MESDEELIQRIVRQQVYSIRLQRKFRNNPLWVAPLTPDERKKRAGDWQEAIRRELHHEIDQKVLAALEAYENDDD